MAQLLLKSEISASSSIKTKILSLKIEVTDPDYDAKGRQLANLEENKDDQEKELQ